jgi:hypothetical protein
MEADVQLGELRPGPRFYAVRRIIVIRLELEIKLYLESQWHYPLQAGLVGAKSIDMTNFTHHGKLQPAFPAACLALSAALAYPLLVYRTLKTWYDLEERSRAAAEGTDPDAVLKNAIVKLFYRKKCW